MMSIGAAQAASSTRQMAVVERETLFEGPVVKMRVPPDAKFGSYPQGGKPMPFLQFSNAIRGGRVNIFVHTNRVDLRGTTIRAKASVLKKTLDDGREYLYIDLVPVEWSVPVTHRLIIVNVGQGSTSPAPQHVFATPLPLRALILFADPAAKGIEE